MFANYNYVHVNPKNVNGFKLMNDEKEMVNLILPKVNNTGEAEYKLFQE